MTAKGLKVDSIEAIITIDLLESWFNLLMENDIKHVQSMVA